MYNAMLRFRVVALSVLLCLFLGAYQVFVSPATGPSSTTSGAHALAAEKKEQKVTATVALPGVQVETMNPYGHSTTQVYPTWKHVIEPLVEWSWVCMPRNMILTVRALSILALPVTRAALSGGTLEMMSTSRFNSVVIATSASGMFRNTISSTAACGADGRSRASSTSTNHYPGHPAGSEQQVRLQVESWRGRLCLGSQAQVTLGQY